VIYSLFSREWSRRPQGYIKKAAAHLWWLAKNGGEEGGVNEGLALG